MSRSCTNASHLTAAIEDYLRTILTLAGVDGATSICAIADRLSISRASASQMVRRLVSLELVRHDHYGKVGLTLEGAAHAEEILRRYTLIESYLITALGYAPEMCAAEVDRIEHAISDQFAERIAVILGMAPATDATGIPGQVG